VWVRVRRERIAVARACAAEYLVGLEYLAVARTSDMGALAAPPPRASRAAQRIFFWSGMSPPASHRPEHYDGFVGVALAWQFAFLAERVTAAPVVPGGIDLALGALFIVAFVITAAPRESRP
jgi:hypothetical protein